MPARPSYAAAVGKFACGAALGGVLVGAGESLYRGVQPWTYGALLYATGWALLGVVAGLLLAGAAHLPLGGWLVPLQRRLDGAWLRAGLYGALMLSAAGLGRFVVWRDVLHEDPQARARALAWGAAVGLSLAAGLLGKGLCTLMAARRVESWLNQSRLAGLTWLVVVGLSATLMWQSRTERAALDRADAGATVASGELPGTAAAPSRDDSAPGGVILLVVDALRADALGAYGAPDHRGRRASPTFDALAAGGTLFRDASAQASWTKPAVASLLTSRHVSGHHTMAKAAVLGENLPTVAEALRAQRPEIFTAAVVTNYNLDPVFGLARGFAHYQYLEPARYLGAPAGASQLAGYNVYRLVRERFLPQWRQARYFYRDAAAATTAALTALDQHPRAPFFLYLHWMEPHDPFFNETGESWARVSEPQPPLSLAPLMWDAYRDEVHRVDAALRDLVAGLRARGRDTSTTLIITSDHGEEFGDHGGFYHGTTLYEELLHVPLLVHGPGVAAREEPRLVRQIDIAPTVLGRFGVSAPSSWEGVDLLASNAPLIPFTLAEQDHEGNRLLAYRPAIAPDAPVARGGAAATARVTRVTRGAPAVPPATPRQQFKVLLANPDNPRGLPALALFDLSRDPREQAPLATTQEPYATQAQELTAAAQQARQRSTAGAGPATPTLRRLDSAQEAALRALGYVQ